jgi:acetyl esterase/lipase
MPDPALFDPKSIPAEIVELNVELVKAGAEAPPINTQEPKDIRAVREDGTGPAGPIIYSDMAEERTIETTIGSIPVRTFVPETVKGVYLHIHGGGWVLGRAHHQDPRLENIAKQCSVAVVSVDYRLAPEHPYSAGPDDCEAVAAWLVENAKSEFGSDKILIGGESAGGHLAVSTLLRMRDNHGYTDFAGANLLYGVYDLSMTPSQANWGDRVLILSTPIMAWFYDHYVPENLRRDPDVSPIYADLTGMPPALFTVGTSDMLLDDTMFMHARWGAAGIPSELEIYPGAVHGFDSLPTEQAQQAHNRIYKFFNSTLNG